MPYKNLQNYEMHFGFGYASVVYDCNMIQSNCLIYVPINRNEKIIIYEVENKLEKDVDAELVYKLEPVLGVAREYTKKHLIINNFQNYVEVKNLYRDSYQNEKLKIYMNKDFEFLDNADKNVLIKSVIKINAKEKVKIKIRVSVENEESLLDEEKDMHDILDYWENMLRKNKNKHTRGISKYYAKWMATDIKLW